MIHIKRVLWLLLLLCDGVACAEWLEGMIPNQRPAKKIEIRDVLTTDDRSPADIHIRLDSRFQIQVIERHPSLPVDHVVAPAVRLSSAMQALDLSIKAFPRPKTKTRVEVELAARVLANQFLLLLDHYPDMRYLQWSYVRIGDSSGMMPIDQFYQRQLYRVRDLLESTQLVEIDEASMFARAGGWLRNKQAQVVFWNQLEARFQVGISFIHPNRIGWLTGLIDLSSNDSPYAKPTDRCRVALAPRS